MSALASDTPAVFLMGATACGKTALSVRVAKAINAEIISVDSALVYRGMDIGTAKPSLTERQGIAHHLIDVRDPWQSYSAAEFCHDANTLINEIHARGRRALLVGGTMLYFKALEEGLADLPQADASVRRALVSKAAKQGWQALHDELRRVDPRAAMRIHPNDPQRLQRALEVYELTGTPLTELQLATRTDLAIAPVKFALMPTDRSWLHQRIEQRLLQMIDLGFLDEVRRLHSDERLASELPAMRSVGYRQAWEHIDEHLSRVGQATGVLPATTDLQAQWVQKAIASTRQLAKRQLTWLRSMPNVKLIECDMLSQEDQIALLTHTLIQHRKPAI